MREDYRVNNNGDRVFRGALTGRVTLDDYLAGAVADDDDDDPRVVAARAVYAGKIELRSTLPELAAEVDGAPGAPPEKFRRCFGPMMARGPISYLGLGGNSTGMHYDSFENLLLVVSGTKRFQLVPPSELERVYPTNHPRYNYASPAPFTDPAKAPIELEKFRGARSVEVT